MSKRDVLFGTSFGQRVAEDEADDLALYFVETEQWRKVFAGEVDIIYGPKGVGKKALVSLLPQKKDEALPAGIFPAAGEKIKRTPVFEELVVGSPPLKEQFRGLWKLYFLSLI